MTEPVIQELAEDFELLGEWDQRYEYIIEIGEGLSGLPAESKTDATQVHGCTSTVHIVGELNGDQPPVMRYEADCDTTIMRGVIAILLMVYNGKTPAECLDYDADEVFEELGLFENLSPTRHVGVYTIVERIREIAQECAGPEASKG